MHFRLSFETAIDEELVTELEKGAAYASARLTRFRLTPDRRAADVECAEGARDEVADKVRKHVAAMIARHRSLGEPEELARTMRRDDRPILEGAFAELERRKWVRRLGAGQVGFAGGALAVKRFVDLAVRDLALERFGAQDEDYPVLLDPAVLARSGYFGSFPHSVCLVAHLVEDFDAIEAFRAANTDTDALRVPDVRALTHADAGLRPAVCLPVYRAFEDTRLPEGGVTITTVGKAFRYESSNMDGIHRLWDFSMREIVFLGSAQAIEGQRMRMVEAVTSLMHAWDLGVRVVSGTDPFFATVRGTKALWQRTRGLKYEVVADAGLDAGPLALGSINFAGTHFADSFHICTAEGETASTACVGFGLERLVLALFAQHGFAPERWPSAMRAVVWG